MFLARIPDGPAASFLSAPFVPLDALDAQFAIIGIPHGVPYTVRNIAPSVADAPRAVRERSARFGRMLGHYDFDLGAAFGGPEPLRLADCGDVPVDPHDLPGGAARATAAVRRIIERGAMPIVLGGDDSTTALALRAFEGHGPLHVLQIDAHLDYRDEVDGVREGYSSPMRRAAEMPWVQRIVHCGQRGLGSARPSDLHDSLARGNAVITARELRVHGVERVIAEFPPGERYYIAFDCDGMDPSVMPGTSAPLPGGLQFYDAVDLITGLARRGRVAGINFAEYYPSLDVNGITALAIVRLIVNLIGAVNAGKR